MIGDASGSSYISVPARIGGWRSLLPLYMVLAIVLALSAVPAHAAKFSAIAVDASNGKVLYAEDVDGLRHPASLTKVMTLYILFQDLKAKRITLSSPLRASARASGMPPSKLGLKPGQTLTVDQAIRALVTRSANDVASIVAENLGGSESAFAARMTKTARAIGMTRSTFRNASGLPDPNQWTTARDMATLSLRIQRDFPQYYPYFKIMSFTWKGQVIRTHNKLLGKFAGTDGIKTGYIRASGFNLTSSAKRGDKRIVGVVLGAKSPVSRNNYMMKMLDKHFARCSNGKTIAASISGAKVTDVAAMESDVAAPAKKTAFSRQSERAQAGKAAPKLQQATLAGNMGEQKPEVLAEGEEAGAGDIGESLMAEQEADVSKTVPFKVKTPEQVAAGGGQVIVPPAQISVAAAATGSWNIQIGAWPTKKDAQNNLYLARRTGIGVLEGKQAYTMQVESGQGTIYRARFSGFNEDSAREACRLLTSRGFGCMAYSPQT